MKVLLDANIFISYLLFPDHPHTAIARVMKACFEGEFELVLPSKLIEEIYNKVSRKPYLKKRITPSQVENMIAILTQLAPKVPKLKRVLPRATRDAKDDYLLAYAMDQNVDFLVTGDQDLLILKKVKNLRIVSPRYLCSLF